MKSRNTLLVLLVGLLVCLLAAAHAQQQSASSLSEGIALYNSGDAEGAIRVLREVVKKSNKDPSAWHYLGLALIQKGDAKEATGMFRKAMDLRSKKLDDIFGWKDGELRDQQVSELQTLLDDQLESQSTLLELLTDQRAREEEQLSAETLTAQSDCLRQNVKVATDGHSVLRKSDMKVEKVRILSRPEPEFPEKARRAKISGIVIIKGVFAADGSTKFLEPFKSDDSSLTEESLRAAASIRFRPASICGKPVSSPLRVEYTFSLN